MYKKTLAIVVAALATITTMAENTFTTTDEDVKTDERTTYVDEEQFRDQEAWTIQGAITNALASRRATANQAGEATQTAESEAPTQGSIVGDKGWKRDNIATVPKFGGYIIGSYKYDSGSDTKGDGFGLRLIRLYVDGTVLKDFKYRLQLEVNGTPHVKDAFIEWQHWDALRIKAGQFKRAFTFENPYNPWDVGMGDYSLLTKKLAGMGDRCGEKSMGGRDLGLQLQGDLFKSSHDGHYQLHYQAAVYNGQGINLKDADRKKDFIGTIQWSPIKGLYIGAFGWKGTWTDGGITVDRDRYAFGASYEGTNGWSARAEYARSRGYKVSDYQDARTLKADKVGMNHADAWYATVGMPVWRWIKVYAKYDAYRDYATNSTMHTMYSLSANLQPHKNLMLQLQYNFNNDRTRALGQHNYHQFWTEAYIRF